MTIDGVGKLLGVAGGLLTIASVGYDHSFLSALGLDFDAVPTTVGDHAPTAVIWAPLVLAIAVAMGLVFQLVVVPVVMIAPEVVTSGAARGLRRPGRWLRAAAFVLLAGFAALVATRASVFEFTPFAALLLLLLFALSFPQQVRALSEQHDTALLCGLIAVTVGCTSAFIGYQRGLALQASQQTRFSIVLKERQDGAPLAAVGMRRFANAAVIAQADGSILVVPDAAIAAIRSSMPPRTSVLCTLLQAACGR